MRFFLIKNPTKGFAWFRGGVSCQFYLTIHSFSSSSYSFYVLLLINTLIEWMIDWLVHHALEMTWPYTGESDNGRLTVDLQPSKYLPQWPWTNFYLPFDIDTLRLWIFFSNLSILLLAPHFLWKFTQQSSKAPALLLSQTLNSWRSTFNILPQFQKTCSKYRVGQKVRPLRLKAHIFCLHLQNAWTNFHGFWHTVT